MKTFIKLCSIFLIIMLTGFMSFSQNYSSKQEGLAVIKIAVNGDPIDSLELIFREMIFNKKRISESLFFSSIERKRDGGSNSLVLERFYENGTSFELILDYDGDTYFGIAFLGENLLHYSDKFETFFVISEIRLYSKENKKISIFPGSLIYLKN